MVVELRLQYCNDILRIHLEPIERFNGVKLFGKSESSILKILCVDCLSCKCGGDMSAL